MDLRRGQEHRVTQLLGLFMKTEIMVAKKCLLLRNTLFNIPSNKCAIDAKGMV